MRLFNFILLTLCLAFMMFVFGIPTGFSAFFGQTPAINGVPGVNGTASGLGSGPISLQGTLTGGQSNNNGVIAAIVGAGIIAIMLAFAIGTGLLTGFSAIYIVAAFIFLFFINLVLIPLSTFGVGGSFLCNINSQGCFLSLTWAALVNLMALATGWEFIAGR
jgi:hypothetical protein